MVTTNPHFDKYREARRQGAPMTRDELIRQHLLGSPNHRLMHSPEFTRGMLAGIGHTMIHHDPDSRVQVEWLIWFMCTAFEASLEESIYHDWDSEPDFGVLGHDQ